MEGGARKNVRESTSALDERVKAVSPRRLEIFGILRDRLASMQFEDDRPTYRAKAAERAIFATRKLLESQAAPNLKSPVRKIHAVTLKLNRPRSRKSSETRATALRPQPRFPSLKAFGRRPCAWPRLLDGPSSETLHKG